MVMVMMMLMMMMMIMMILIDDNGDDDDDDEDDNDDDGVGDGGGGGGDETSEIIRRLWEAVESSSALYAKELSTVCYVKLLIICTIFSFMCLQLHCLKAHISSRPGFPSRFILVKNCFMVSLILGLFVAT